MSITALEPEFEPVRIGMIGVGRHARLILLPSLTFVPELQLCAVATAHEETARLAGQRYRVPAYVGYEEMLERQEDLEAILVVGGKHQPEIRAVLEAGKHVWCETPAVTDAEDAADLRALAQTKELRVEVGSCLRHAPIYLRLKEELEEWNRTSPGPRLFQASYYPYVGHFYNLFQYLNGPWAAVSVLQGPLETLVHMRFVNGDIGAVVSRKFHNDSIPFEQVSVSAEDGLLIAANGRDLRRYYTPEPRTGMELSFDTAAADLIGPTFSMPYGRLNHLYLRGYIPQLQHFARMVRQGASSVCGLADMEETLRLRQAITRAAETQDWIEL